MRRFGTLKYRRKVFIICLYTTEMKKRTHHVFVFNFSIPPIVTAFLNICCTLKQSSALLLPWCIGVAMIFQIIYSCEHFIQKICWEQKRIFIPRAYELNTLKSGQILEKSKIKCSFYPQPWDKAFRVYGNMYQTTYILSSQYLIHLLEVYGFIFLSVLSHMKH